MTSVDCKTISPPTVSTFVNLLKTTIPEPPPPELPVSFWSWCPPPPPPVFAVPEVASPSPSSLPWPAPPPSVAVPGVVPGLFVTIATSLFDILFIKLDLPVFDFPIIPTINPLLIFLPLLLFFKTLYFRFETFTEKTKIAYSGSLDEINDLVSKVTEMIAH